MPLILWAFRRLLLRGGRKYFALAVLSLAALLLTHNISSLIFVPVLIVYIFVLRIAYSVQKRQITRYSLLVTLFAFVLALALTAFFWLPALAEGQSAQLYLTHSARGNDYHFNFATAVEVFGPPGSVGSGAAQSAAAHCPGLGADRAWPCWACVLDQAPGLARAARARHHCGYRRRDLHFHGAARLAARCGTRCR